MKPQKEIGLPNQPVTKTCERKKSVTNQDWDNKH